MFVSACRCQIMNCTICCSNKHPNYNNITLNIQIIILSVFIKKSYHCLHMVLFPQILYDVTRKFLSSHMFQMVFRNYPRATLHISVIGSRRTNRSQRPPPFHPQLRRLLTALPPRRTRPDPDPGIHRPQLRLRPLSLRRPHRPRSPSTVVDWGSIQDWIRSLLCLVIRKPRLLRRTDCFALFCRIFSLL